MKRTEVPSRSAASSTVNSLSILLALLLLCGGHGAKFLTSDAPHFAGTGSSRQSQPALALARIARADVYPGGDDDHGLVVLGAVPGIQGDTVAGPTPLGELHTHATQDGEGGRVAAALGRPVTAEPEHVRPRPQPEPFQLSPTAQLPGRPDEIGHIHRELVEVLQVVGGGEPAVKATAEALSGLGRVLGDIAGHL